MSSHHAQTQFSQSMLVENSYPLPQTFAAAIAHLQSLVLQEFDREITEKQLCYHTREHIEGVQRRANRIWQAIHPYLPMSSESHRLELLLDLCAVAHDLIQIFVPQSQPYIARRREAGVSEMATIEVLFADIQSLNRLLQAQNADDSTCFTDADLEVIRAAIEATVCLYDPADQAIYQPALYGSSQPLSLVAQIIALADIGALGMEGIDAYHREGCLLLLEENPDLLPMLQRYSIEALASNKPELYENMRQRLLRRARFQVNFAQSRLARFPREIANLPEDAITVLTHEVFQFLNQDTLCEIEQTTPTDENTSLANLIEFFKLRQGAVLQRLSV